MKSLNELSSRGCKYALTDGGAAPDMTWQRANYRHLFCDEPARNGSPYCEKHHAVCYCGTGRDWRSTERMMKAVEQSVRYQRPRDADRKERVENSSRSFEGQFGVDNIIKGNLTRASRKTRRR